MTDDDTEDLQAERRAARQKMWALLAHPDVRDPDYPEDEGDDE